jgi:hypothetical protein
MKLNRRWSISSLRPDGCENPSRGRRQIDRRQNGVATLIMTTPVGTSSRDAGDDAAELRPLTHADTTGGTPRGQGFMRCHQNFTNRSSCCRRAAPGSRTFSRESIPANVEGE